jgi:hypothetical protein
MKGLSVKFRFGLTNIHKNTIRPSINYWHVIDVYFHTINEFEYLFKKMQYKVSLKRPRQSLVSLTCKLIAKRESLKAQLFTKDETLYRGL